MKVTRINATATQLTFLGFSNCYLLLEEDGFTLIDTSFPGKGKDIVRAAAEAGHPIRRILLTHAHPDHMGSLDQLHQILGNIDVAISEREAPLLHKDLRLRPNEPQQKLIARAFPGAKTRPTHTLTEGELFGSLRCIGTPGHTPGQMSFLDERDGTLFAGDALIALGGPLRVCSVGPWWNPIPKIFTWDKPLANQSAQKLEPFHAATILSGHGPAVFDGPQALRSALTQIQKA